MAEERIAEILRECVERHGLAAAAAEHRTGSVSLGESSVIVSVSAPHREEAFSGAREAIDRIKAEAPIWKREVGVTAAGEERRWVEGSVPPHPASDDGSLERPAPSRRRRRGPDGGRGGKEQQSATLAPRLSCGCRPRPPGPSREGDSRKGDVAGLPG